MTITSLPEKRLQKSDQVSLGSAVLPEARCLSRLKFAATITKLGKGSPIHVRLATAKPCGVTVGVRAASPPPVCQERLEVGRLGSIDLHCGNWRHERPRAGPGSWCHEHTKARWEVLPHPSRASCRVRSSRGV